MAQSIWHNFTDIDHSKSFDAVHRYRDAEEPQLGSHSVTIRPSAQDIQKLYLDAEDTWTGAFVKLIKVRQSKRQRVQQQNFIASSSQ